MSRIRVWFPEYYTEAHREPHHQALLVAALYKHGVDCVREYDDQCDLIFCGSFFHYDKVQTIRIEKLPKPLVRATRAEKAAHKKRIPIVHYNWDMYPFNIDTDPEQNYYG